MTRWLFPWGFDPTTPGSQEPWRGLPVGASPFFSTRGTGRSWGDGDVLHVEKDKAKGNTRRDPRPQAPTRHVLDLRGMIVPLTLLKITQGFRELQGGETLEILGTDTDTRNDALSVLKKSPCEVVCICDEQDHYMIRLRKNRR